MPFDCFYFSLMLAMETNLRLQYETTKFTALTFLFGIMKMTAAMGCPVLKNI